MNVTVKTFKEITSLQLHDIFKLRSEVFIVEQNCVYQDIDGKDFKALHVIGEIDGKVVAYTRCFKPGIYFNEAAIGRVVVAMEYRKYGYGHDIMKASIKAIKDNYNLKIIKLSAQTYLKDFYESHGFTQIGEGYLEDGIAHIAMLKLK